MGGAGGGGGVVGGLGGLLGLDTSLHVAELVISTNNKSRVNRAVFILLSGSASLSRWLRACEESAAIINYLITT